MYYKILNNDDKVVDVLHQLIFLRWHQEHQMMMICEERRAQGILSSDADKCWHIEGMYRVPVDGYPAMKLVQISKEEYERLHMLNGKTPEEIIDNYTLYLINKGVL